MKILIFGGTGMVGSGLANVWKENHTIIAPKRDEADLMDCEDFKRWCRANGYLIDQCDLVVYAAGDVGGISAQNNYYKQLTNSTMYLNFMECLKYIRTTTKVINLSSSCMYPVKPRKLFEYDLHSGDLEYSNLGYGMSKVFGYTLLHNWNQEHSGHAGAITLVLPNLYSSVSDNNFHPGNAHVAQALIGKFKYAMNNPHVKEVNVWGSGRAVREYMDVAEIAKVIETLIKFPEKPYDLYNVGPSKGIQIKSYAEKIAEIVGYKGNIFFDTTKPEGTLYKVMDNSRLYLCTATVPSFDQEKMIQDLLDNYKEV